MGITVQVDFGEMDTDAFILKVDHLSLHGKSYVVAGARKMQGDGAGVAQGTILNAEHQHSFGGQVFSLAATMFLVGKLQVAGGVKRHADIVATVIAFGHLMLLRLAVRERKKRIDQGTPFEMVVHTLSKKQRWVIILIIAHKHKRLSIERQEADGPR
jgi:hypothetical protein